MRACTAVTAAVLWACLLGGCIERELVITSQPAGARVFISDEEVGRTPVRKSFTWYGVYDIVLRLDGYETLEVQEHVKPPAHQYPPLDLFVELWPGTIYDRRELNYTLKKLELSPRDELIERAMGLKQQTERKVVRPAPYRRFK